MKLNYPVKYAAMPIIEQTGWTHGLNELERRYEPVCYIVSKCYLISETTKYNENGESKKEYEVVFPYQKEINFGNYERRTPSFNLIHGACTNSYLTYHVFDTYDEALTHADILNGDLCEKTWVNLPYSEDLMEKIKAKQDEFDEKLDFYLELEEKITEATKNLQVGTPQVPKKVIREYEDGFKESCYNVYETMKYNKYSPYVIYHVTEKEYELMLREGLIPSEALPIIYHATSSDDMIIIDTNKYICEYGAIKETESIPDVIEEIRAKEESPTAYYTTESLEDIIESYQSYENIELDRSKQKAKRLIKK